MQRDQLFRFLAVGVLNTFIDLLVFLLLVPHISLVPATIVAAGCGMAFSFLANGRFTFRDRYISSGRIAAFLLINVLVLWMLQPIYIVAALSFFPVPHSSLLLTAVKLSAVGVCFMLNFFLYRRFVWPVAR